MCFMFLFREIGGRRLVVETRLAKDLSEFSSDLSQEGLQFWKIAFSAMTCPGSYHRGTDSTKFTKDQMDQSPSPSGNQKVILLPCKSAPSRDRVQLWLHAKRQYECLQRDRKRNGAKQLMLDQGKAQLVDSKSPNREGLQDEGSKRVSALQTFRRKGLSLSLHISPVEGATSDNSQKDTRCVTNAINKGQEEEEGDSFKQTPPDSPDLTPWQQTTDQSFGQMDPDDDRKELAAGSASPSLGGPISPSCKSPDSIKPGQFLSPSPFPMKDKDGDSPSPCILHSTPVLSRRRSKGDPEVDISPLGSEGSDSCAYMKARIYV